MTSQLVIFWAFKKKIRPRPPQSPHPTLYLKKILANKLIIDLP